MKRITVKLIPFVLSLVLLFSLGVSAQAEQSGTYVLMNIPYAEFYAAEVTVTEGLDAVSSSTLMKPRAGTLAGGSYHVDPEGSDISGVIFPVFVEDAAVLESLGGKEIHDEDKVEITVTLKGNESMTSYEGRDALFEASDYSWYVLSEAPAQYKTLTVEDGKPAFSAVNTEAEKVMASAALVYDKHADQVIAIEGIDKVLGTQQVSGIILTADDGTRVGLRHIANIWRGMETGFKLDSAVYEALKGKTIVSFEYLTKEGHYAFDSNVRISADPRLAALSDTYIELFPEFAKEELKDYWMECIKAYPVDDEMAEMFYTMLTQQFMGRLVGPEAEKAYADDPSAMMFDCFFENGVAKLTINGDEISGVDAEGKEIFRNVYAFTEDMTVTYFGEEMPSTLHVYKADAENAGQFTYFAFTDDTLAGEQHIEFRYGDTLENLNNYSEGAYAYWLAAGIQDGYSEKLIQACIKLFVDENVGEQFAEAEAIEISTAEELAAVNENLSGNYVLTADIDLAGIDWAPIGSFVITGETEEEQVVPPEDAAFTGTFDGQGHTIRNMTVNQPDAFAVGLFSCMSNATVGNFVLENAAADGTTMVGCVVGYAYCSEISGVTLKGGKVTAHASEMSAEGMYAGIIGAGMGSLIQNCDVQADILIPDNTANAGIVGGGLEMTNVVGCKATGTVTAGNNCYGIGGVSGCGFGSEMFTDCTAENVVITTGDNCFWIGGITGYTGGYAETEFGIPVTVLTNCNAINVSVTTGENAEGTGDIVGAGFFNEEAAALGAPYDQPTQYELVNCTAEPAVFSAE